MTSTSYCLPGMRPTSWMRCSVTFFPRVVLSTRAERFQRSRWYRSKSPAGGSQFTRRVLSQPPPPAFRSETFWGTETQRRRESFSSGGFQARHNWTLARHASEHSYCAQISLSSLRGLVAKEGALFEDICILPPAQITPIFTLGF